jgi:hypothetical protein
LPSHCTLTVGKLADVALDEAEVGPLVWGDQALDFVQVALMAGGEVIDAYHALVQLEQGFQQIAADEASHAGNQPSFGGLAQFFLDFFVAGHVCAYRRPSAAPSGRMLFTS